MTMLKYIAISDDSVVIYLDNTCLFLISRKLNYQPIHMLLPCTDLLNLKTVEMNN